MKIAKLICVVLFLFSFMGLLWGFEERIPVEKPVTGLCGFKPGELLRENKNFGKLWASSEFEFRANPLPVKFRDFQNLIVSMLSDGRIACVSLRKICESSRSAYMEYYNIRRRLNAYFNVDQAQLDPPPKDDSVYSTTYYAQDLELTIKYGGDQGLTLQLISKPLHLKYAQECEQRAHQEFMETDAKALE